MKTINLIARLLCNSSVCLGWVLVLVLSDFMQVSQAQARPRIRIDVPPPPRGSSARGGSPNGVEGLENLGDRIQGDPNLILPLLEDFQVRDGDGLRRPDNVIGDGNLFDVVRTAADVWEEAFADSDFSIDIGIGWADFDNDTLILGDGNSFDPDGTVAFYIPADEYPENLEAFPDNLTDDLEFPEDGLILFNTQLLKATRNPESPPESFSTLKLYLDPDPRGLDLGRPDAFGALDNFFERADADFQLDLDSNPDTKTNISREVVGDFSKFNLGSNVLTVDLFTVALHELQHALGLTRANPKALDRIVTEIVPGEPNHPTGDRPKATLLADNGLGIPITAELEDGIPRVKDVHIDLRQTNGARVPGPVLDEFVSANTRRCPTEVDVRGVAAVSGPTPASLNPCGTLDPKSVPEPASLIALLTMGAGGLLVSQSSWKKRQP